MILWTLNLIAVELENPFGSDPNDIDGPQMQLEMNNHLRLLLCAETQRIPRLNVRGGAVPLPPKINVVFAEYSPESEAMKFVNLATINAFTYSHSFHEIWCAMATDDISPVTAPNRRFSHATNSNVELKIPPGGKDTVVRPDLSSLLDLRAGSSQTNICDTRSNANRPLEKRIPIASRSPPGSALGRGGLGRGGGGGVKTSHFWRY